MIFGKKLTLKTKPLTVESSALQLQDEFIKTSIHKKTDLFIYLVNGVKLHGKILAQDKYTILFTFNEKQTLVYKSAIATILAAESLVHGS